MDDKFLSYYNMELMKIRELADKFAIQNPKVAGRLRMGPGFCDDPHASRIIEAFAFLTAQLQLNIDDDFSLICETLLSQLYPHYVKTIPAMSIVQIVGAPGLESVYQVPKGSLIRASTLDEAECHFQTGYTTTLLPLEIQAAELVSNYNKDLLSLTHCSNITSTLTLTFSALNPDYNLSSLRNEKVRVFINLDTFSALKCHELISHSVEAILFTSPTDQVSRSKPIKDMIHRVGFSEEDSILPYSENSLMAYRLLTEYFVFPDKFLFFDISLSPEDLQFDFGNKFHIVLFLKNSYPDLENFINKNSFLLGCTPIINMFRKQAEPIHYDNSLPYYYIIPDARKRTHYDIVDIIEVKAVAEANQSVICLPFYSVEHARDDSDRTYYWQAFPSDPLENASKQHFNPTMKIALVDLDTHRIVDSLVVNVALLCSNGSLVNDLPYGADQQTLCLVDGSSAITSINSIKPFTKPINPRKKGGGQWRFLSHLQLNYLSLGDAKGAVNSLQELLRLYDFDDSAQTKKIINSLHNIFAKQVTKRGPGTMQASMCTGLSITLAVDMSQFKESSPYLFLSILNAFFTMYVTINTFIELTVISHSHNGVVFQWPAMIGSKQLI